MAENRYHEFNNHPTAEDAITASETGRRIIMRIPYVPEKNHNEILTERLASAGHQVEIDEDGFLVKGDGSWFAAFVDDTHDSNEKFEKWWYRHTRNSFGKSGDHKSISHTIGLRDLRASTSEEIQENGLTSGEEKAIKAVMSEEFEGSGIVETMETITEDTNCPSCGGYQENVSDAPDPEDSASAEQ